jgi:hypothetical protein
MKMENFLSEFEKAKKRIHVIGTSEASVIIALDMEGRIFTILHGDVLNKVNLEAIKGQSTSNNYLNPGGDALWPAPEGTTLGYQYSTGDWRVSPGLNYARYLVTESGDNHVTITAEIDLINNQGLGIPTIFRRKILLLPDHDSITLSVTESITYIGNKTLKKSECNLAPWSLCQLDCDLGSKVSFPCQDISLVWNLYDSELNDCMSWENLICNISTEGTKRFQIGIGEKVPYIEFFDPSKGLKVKRINNGISSNEMYIDIRDVKPTIPPDPKGVRYSVYNDNNGFMEIEAAGGCPEIIHKGTEMKVTVETTFIKN